MLTVSQFRYLWLGLALLCGLGVSATHVAVVSAKQPTSSWRISPKQRTILFRTPYSRVTLLQRNGYRCLAFGSGWSLLTQTCMHLTRKLDFGSEYVKMMFSLSSLVTPKPRRILILGLGGAALPKLTQTYFPQAVVDNVDIDPGVIAMARYYFRFQTSPKMRVYAADARGFVQHMAGKRKYDLIYIDCFDDKYIPAHLLNLSFFREVVKLVQPRGLVVANIFSSHRKYQETVHTWQTVLPHLWLLRGKTSGNVIVFGSPSRRWTYQQLLARAKAFESKHKPVFSFTRQMKKARPADQKSKAALLREKQTKRYPFQATNPLPSHCKAPCCGLQRRWQGTFQVPAGKQMVTYTMRGRLYQAHGQCYGSFHIRWPRSQEVLELFRVKVHPDSVHMKGILVKDGRYELDTFTFPWQPKQRHLRGTFRDKRGRKGPIVLR